MVAVHRLTAVAEVRRIVVAVVAVRHHRRLRAIAQHHPSRVAVIPLTRAEVRAVAIRVADSFNA